MKNKKMSEKDKAEEKEDEKALVEEGNKREEQMAKDMKHMTKAKYPIEERAKANIYH